MTSILSRQREWAFPLYNAYDTFMTLPMHTSTGEEETTPIYIYHADRAIVIHIFLHVNS